jgi:hypothetical protein
MTLLTTILQNDTVKVMVLDNTKTFVEYIKEPSSIIAFVAIVLSLFGIIFSVFYNRKTIDLSIKHTKLSIEPILNLQIYISNNDNSIKIELINYGLGTAYIKSLDILYNENTFNNFYELIKDNLFDGIDYKVQYFMLGNNNYLSSDKNILLYKYTVNTASELESIKSLLRKTKITLKYESMYGDKKEMTHNNLIK